MRWPRFLRDPHGTIVLEEVDEDAGTATWRVYGRGSVTATQTAAGIEFEGEPPAELRAALEPPAFGRFVAASRSS